MAITSQNDVINSSKRIMSDIDKSENKYALKVLDKRAKNMLKEGMSPQNMTSIKKTARKEYGKIKKKIKKRSQLFS